LKPRKTGGRMPKGVRLPTFFYLSQVYLILDNAANHAR